MNTESITKVLRLNSIVDVPSSIESMFVLNNILAVARSDNTIELWDTNTWIQIIKIFGSKEAGIRRVFLRNKDKDISNLKLYTAGLNGYLIEWDLYTMRQKHYYHNPGGSLWDVDINDKLALLACDDGSPRVVKMKKNTLFLQKQFSKINSKILSVKWDNNVFYSGHSDGNINK
jgi:WD40 repeat protein